jgi:poly-gamma-glutamate capsule biosynthesis protein CapA/YwtB (metallophosphatase superfamily)
MAVDEPGQNPSRMHLFVKANPSIIRQRATPVRCLICSIVAAAFLNAGEYQPSASLVFFGDIMLGRGVAEAHAAGDWESVLQSLHPVTRAADLALANLESPIGCDSTLPSDPRSLAAPPGAAKALGSAGMDVLSTANNHALDAGPDGRRCSIHALAALGIDAINSFSIPVEKTIRGLRMVFLALDFIGDKPPEAVGELERAIRRAHGAGKVVVVSLHWGLEYQSGHDSFQEQIAARLVDAGADILWGHHPHVVQEIEWRKGSLILYSLGNAVFDQREPDPVRRGTLVWADVDRRGARSIMILPFAIDPRRGKTGPPDFLSLRFSSPQIHTARDIIPEKRSTP